MGARGFRCLSVCLGDGWGDRRQTDDLVLRYIETGLFKNKLDGQDRRCLVHECHAYSKICD